MKSSLSEKEQNIIQDLYVKCREQILKSLDEYDDVSDYFAWFAVIPMIMKAVEVYKLPGNKKTDIVVEVVCMVIEKDTGVENKEDLIKKIRENSPKVIASIAKASHYLNAGSRLAKKFAKMVSKYCKCCCKCCA